MSAIDIVSAALQEERATLYALRQLSGEKLKHLNDREAALVEPVLQLIDRLMKLMTAGDAPAVAVEMQEFAKQLKSTLKSQRLDLAAALTVALSINWEMSYQDRTATPWSRVDEKTDAGVSLRWRLPSFSFDGELIFITRALGAAGEFEYHNVVLVRRREVIRYENRVHKLTEALA